MSPSPLTLSMDSLIAAFALSGVVRPRHFAPLATFFGVCDLSASAVGLTLGATMSAWSVLPACALLLVGALILLTGGSITKVRALAGWPYLLPPLLAIDNLLTPDTPPIAAGIGSSALALVGFVAGAVLFRTSTPVHSARRWIQAWFAMTVLSSATRPHCEPLP